MRFPNRTGTSRPESGFTLVEIMGAVLIMAVVLGIAIPSLRRARENSRISQAQAELEILAAAVRQLAWDTGKWPAALDRSVKQSTESWDLTASNAGLLSNNGGYQNWQGPYIPEIHSDPWDSPYFFDPDYRISGVDRIVVGSFGPNKQGRNLYDSDDIYVIVDDGRPPS